MTATGDILARQAAQVAQIEARAAAAPGGEYGVFLSAEHQLLIHTEIPVLIAMLRQSHAALHAVLALGDGPDAIGPDGGLISWPRIRKAVEARFGDAPVSAAAEVMTVADCQARAFVDCPTAWMIARRVEPAQHEAQCSFNTTNGAILCDCKVLTGSPEWQAACGPQEADR